MKERRLLDKIRKPVNHLTLADLERFPIWEFALDEEGVEGQDETWVRPVESNAIPRDSRSLTVSATFTLANGNIHHGVVGYSAADGMGSFECGVINSEGVYLFIPHNFPPELPSFIASLGADVRGVFPMKYQLKVPVEGERDLRTGEIWIKSQSL